MNGEATEGVVFGNETAVGVTAVKATVAAAILVLVVKGVFCLMGEEVATARLCVETVVAEIFFS